jgi:hypothetical protein
MAEEKLIGHVYSDRLYIPAAEMRIRYRKEFHLKNFYRMLHDWFVEEKWVKRIDYEWPEHFYLLRETQRGNEMWIWWRFKKIPGAGEAGTNSYYRYNLDVFWHITGAKDVEVMHQGKKYKTQYADIEFYIKAKIEMDYQHEDGKGWRDHALLKHFNDVFHKRLFKPQLQRHKHDLFREAYRLQEVVKLFFGLKTYMPEKEGQEYDPATGIGDIPGLEGVAPK